jgi:hypothetical protein
MVASTQTHAPAAPAQTDYSNLTREDLERELVGLLHDVTLLASEQAQANAIVDQRLASIESKLGLTFHGSTCNS